MTAPRWHHRPLDLGGGYDLPADLLHRRPELGDLACVGAWVVGWAKESA